MFYHGTVEWRLFNSTLHAGEAKANIIAAPYADNYRKCVSQVTADMMLHKRPALTALPESIAAYDAIVLGYPNYCGTIPMAVATFLEAFDFTGKKLLPYCTNEGSGMGRSEKDLRKLCPTAVIAPGLAITGSAAAQSQAALVGWMQENL